MAEKTQIEWTDSTWNVVNGCSVVSPGCINCYAMRLAGTRMKHHPSRAGLTQNSKAAPVWTGEVRFNDKALLDPLRWRRPRRIFVCAHGDLFHEAVPDEWIDKVFAVMALAPRHQFQLLTKRPERMRAYLTATEFPGGEEGGFVIDRAHWLQSVCEQLGGDGMAVARWPLPNVWLGVSVEDQARADERIPILLDTPAAVRWLSCEPLLGPVDLRRLSTFRFRGAEVLDALTGTLEGMFGDHCARQLPSIDWVVAGGESGPGARPMHPDWARSLRDQCAGAGVPFLFKQWGDWAPCESLNGTERPGEFPAMKVGKKRAGRLVDGQLHDAFPG